MPFYSHSKIQDSSEIYKSWNYPLNECKAYDTNTYTCASSENTVENSDTINLNIKKHTCKNQIKSSKNNMKGSIILRICLLLVNTVLIIGKRGQ